MEPASVNPRAQDGGNSPDTSKILKQYFSPPINPKSPLVEFVPSGLSGLASKRAPSALLISSKEDKPKPQRVDFNPLSNAEFSAKPHNRIQAPQRAATASYLSPIFHFTSYDTTIIAMEHNNHYKLMAISTSRREIFVTLTQEMPVVENMGAIKAEDLFGAGGGLSGSGGPPPPFLDEGLSKWDPTEMTVLVDQLQHPCTQLEWGPWQHGVYLAGVCPGWQIRVYRFSHGRWALDADIKTPNGVSIAFSSQCTLACACSSGEILLFVRRSDSPNGEGPWVPCCTFSTGPEDYNITALPRSAGDSIRDAGSSFVGPDLHFSSTSNPNICTVDTNIAHGGPSKRCLCVHFDDTGSLLGSGHQDGSVRVFLVVDSGTRIRDVVFSSEPTHRSGMCRQVVWSPSSGRNFLLLAIVYANYFTILLFQRPRLHNLSTRSTGLPSGATALFPHAHMYTPLGDSGVAVRSAPKAGERALKLQVLESTTVACEGLSKLSWNTTGTRFVTSHADGLVHTWAVDISYVQRHEQPHPTPSNGGKDKNMAARTGMGLRSGKSGGAGDGTSHLGHGYQQRTTEGETASCEGLPVSAETSFPENGVDGNNKPAGEHRISELKLSILMSLRKVSSAHPYHTVAIK